MVLVETARNHATTDRGRSLDRCVALAGDGYGRYRLWQITRLAAEAGVEEPPAEAISG
jgi:hypothetical protein